MRTTVGQLLVNEELPEHLRDYGRVLDQAGVAKLFGQVEATNKGQYAELNRRMHDVGQKVSTAHGREASFKLDDLRVSPKVAETRDKLNALTKAILLGPGTSREKDQKIVEAIAAKADQVTEDNYQEGLKTRNPFSLQVLSGSRGNKVQLRTLTAGDMLVTDHRGDPIPMPLLSSYAEGLDPVQYWSSTYGARASEYQKKFATPKAGYLGKQLSAAAHRLVVRERDCGTTNGIPVPANEPDNEGSVLAQDADGIHAGTVLTPDIMRKLGDKNVLVRSAMTCQSEHGVCSHCAGVREQGKLAPIGSFIGLAAAQALAEPLAQGVLGAKHKGGSISTSRAPKEGALDVVNRMVQVPETFPGAAAVAQADGFVDNIADAPQGGKHVMIGGQQHWVSPERAITVKKGDTVEAGDVLSDGMPNPSDIVKHKGIGEGRRYFSELFKKTLAEQGFKHNRRNIELVARGLINHVRITSPHGPGHTVMDDLVEFDPLMKGYEPRQGTKGMEPKQATGLYLERPVLHYSVGTRVTPRVARTMGEHGIQTVDAHPEPPQFQPEMVRAVEILTGVTVTVADDWMVRLGGLYGIQRSFLKSVHRGASSDTKGDSYMPALAEGTALKPMDTEEED